MPIWFTFEVGIYDPPRPLIPKIIWSYWEDLHLKEGAQKAFIEPREDINLTKKAMNQAFIGLCQNSWKSLNPGWDIRVLDQAGLIGADLKESRIRCGTTSPCRIYLQVPRRLGSEVLFKRLQQAEDSAPLRRDSPGPSGASDLLPFSTHKANCKTYGRLR